MYLLKWKFIHFFQQIFTGNLYAGPCKNIRAMSVKTDKDLETWKARACHAEGKASRGCSESTRAVFPERHGAGGAGAAEAREQAREGSRSEGMPLAPPRPPQEHRMPAALTELWYLPGTPLSWG